VSESLPPRPRPSIAQRCLPIGVLAFVAACVLSLELSFAALFDPGAGLQLAAFLGGFLPPTHDLPFLRTLGHATLETFAMSLVGTALAAAVALPLAALLARPPHRIAARRTRAVPTDLLRAAGRLGLIALRSVPELVWAALLLVAVGVGPASGTLALSLHSSGVLARLQAEALENLDPAPAEALRLNGASALGTFLHGTLPLAAPRLLSWTLYRWESNVRAAALLGLVGAGGLGQSLHVSFSLFRLHDAAAIALAMLALIAGVDALSFRLRRSLMR